MEEREPQLAVEVGVPCDGANGEESCRHKGRKRVGKRLSPAELNAKASDCISHSPHQLPHHEVEQQKHAPSMALGHITLSECWREREVLKVHIGMGRNHFYLAWLNESIQPLKD